MKDGDETLTPELMLRAYASGIFPMAESRDAAGLFWVDPPKRGILPLERFHISRSLARRMRRARYSVSLDHAFEAVIAGCAERPETWINAQLHRLYRELYARGCAHSLEIWRQGRLAGGVFGITLGGAFFGESMFSRRTDASKLALAHLVDHLRRCGFSLFDTQFLTPHLASLGAIELPRARYRMLLHEALQARA